MSSVNQIAVRIISNPVCRELSIVIGRALNPDF